MFGDLAKVVIKGKFIVIQAYLEKQEKQNKTKQKPLTFHLNKQNQK